jgi:prepilin-type N-terminal cleavage/methylation domain-containing protein
MLTRRGFTLVELLVALVLMGIVSAGIYRVLINNQRIYQAQTQRIDLQQNLRAAVTILPAELRELDAADGDIIDMGPSWITVRGTRRIGFVCDPPVIGVLAGNVAAAVVKVRNDPQYGARGIDFSTDSLLVYYEGNQGNTNDDGWVRGDLPAAGAPAVCLDVANSAATQYNARLWFTVGQFAVTGMIPNGAPVRAFEPVSYSVYQAGDGRWYLGYQSRHGGGVRQPLIGPLSGANGVRFDYFTAAGGTTGVPTQVAQIRITLFAETAQLVRQRAGAPAYVSDSIVTTVSLRNNRRWVTGAPGS